jgi:hypothetical protein
MFAAALFPVIPDQPLKDGGARSITSFIIHRARNHFNIHNPLAIDGYSPCLLRFHH